MISVQLLNDSSNVGAISWTPKNQAEELLQLQEASWGTPGAEGYRPHRMKSPCCLLRGLWFWTWNVVGYNVMILLMEEIPNNHLGCKKSCKWWDKLPTSTGDRRISSINSMSCYVVLFFLSPAMFHDVPPQIFEKAFGLKVWTESEAIYRIRMNYIDIMIYIYIYAHDIVSYIYIQIHIDKHLKQIVAKGIKRWIIAIVTKGDS